MYRQLNNFIWFLGAIAFMMLIAPFAFAGDNNGSHRSSAVSSSDFTGDFDSTSSSDATSSSTSESTGGSAEASIGDITINVPGSDAGGASAQASSLSADGGTAKSEIKLKNVPTTIAPDIYPTVPCFKGGSFSIGWSGFGGSAGGGKVDQDCVKREYIRLAHAMGAADRALFMWCLQPAVYEDFGTTEDCLKFSVEQPEDTQASYMAGSSPDPMLMAELSEEEIEEYIRQQKLIVRENAEQESVIELLIEREEDLTEQVRRLEREQIEREVLEREKRRKLEALLEKEI